MTWKGAATEQLISWLIPLHRRGELLELLAISDQPTVIQKDMADVLGESCLRLNEQLPRMDVIDLASQ